MIIKLTEKQIEKLAPLNEMAQNAFNQGKPGMILAQIALQNVPAEFKDRYGNVLNRGECLVEFVSSAKAKRLQQIMMTNVED